MTYKTKDIITPIHEFIQTCPFASEFGVNLDNLTYQNFNDGDYTSSAIEYTGSIPIDSEVDVRRRRKTITRQANFTLWLVVEDDYDFLRKETGLFLYNFEHWIEDCQMKNLTPKLSSDKQDYDVENFYADGSTHFSKYGETDKSVYVIQLHVLYKNRY